MSKNVPKIIIVDDEQMILDIFTRYLGRQGYSVVPYDNVADAIPHVAEADLILSDLDMKPIDGIAFLKHIRIKFPEKKFILTTGSTDLDMIEKAKAMGVDSVFRKPGDLDELVFLVEKHVGRAL